MEKLPERIHDEGNGIDYVLVGDYYIPDLKLPEESRPIGRWGEMRQTYLKEYHHARYISLLLTGELWTYLADLNEQAEKRMETIVRQMMETGGVTEELKSHDQMGWVRKCISIRNRAEEIICAEMIYDSLT